MNHPNLVPALGAGPDIAELCVVSPWMPEGDLLQYLNKYPGAHRVAIVRIYVAHVSMYTEFDIQDDGGHGRALLSPFQRGRSRRLEGGQWYRSERLHSLTAMRQANILFDKAGIPQLADFGASSITFDPTSKNASTPSGSYSLRWAAPEILQAPNDKPWRPTMAADVYAFGMVVVEVRTITSVNLRSNHFSC